MDTENTTGGEEFENREGWDRIGWDGGRWIHAYVPVSWVCIIHMHVYMWMSTCMKRGYGIIRISRVLVDWGVRVSPVGWDGTGWDGLSLSSIRRCVERRCEVY